MIVGIGLDNIVNNDRDNLHERILKAWIKDWESEILITRYQENGQRLLKK